MLLKTQLRRPAFWIQGGIIGALYVALTLSFAAIGYGPIQFRISEALTILPFFAPSAVPGLFIGCAISNLFGGFGLPDVIFGSLATLLAAICTYKIKNQWLAPLPSVLINALVIGGMLSVIEGLPFFYTALTVGAGQTVACYALGLPLLLLLKRYQTTLFR